MKRAAIFLADGFEEIEALTVVDILRRGGVEITMCSVMDRHMVHGSHGIDVTADCMYGETETAGLDMLVLPGGKAGTEFLEQYEPLLEALKAFYQQRKYIAAICAAPRIFGKLGFLENREATAYPTFEGMLTGAQVVRKPAVVSGHVITGRSMGTAIPFALALLEMLEGRETAERIRKEIVYKEICE
ncbi:MAG TPA: DJ-1 family protein [Lachnospiraceae bacterium]|nr:DJ-1 family protein [Lachnospiraceae bacterium]